MCRKISTVEGDNLLLLYRDNRYWHGLVLWFSCNACHWSQ